MWRVVVALFAVAFLDAVSTYIVVTFGLGMEANPAVADIVNNNPAALFPLAVASAAVPSAALYVAMLLEGKLLARLRLVATRLATAALLAAVAIRAVVVVNNVSIIVTAFV